jgi:hypothetical protein
MREALYDDDCLIGRGDFVHSGERKNSSLEGA